MTEKPPRQFVLAHVISNSAFGRTENAMINLGSIASSLVAGKNVIRIVRTHEGREDDKGSMDGGS